MGRPAAAFVGQAPSRTSVGRPAFDGSSGDRLARHAGLCDRDELRHAFALFNLLSTYPGAAGKGDGFVACGRARRAVQRLRSRLRRRPVVLCGRHVARAFRADHLDWLEWARVDGLRVAVLPHPSGVNMWWNDPGNRADARTFLDELPRRRT